VNRDKLDTSITPFDRLIKDVTSSHNDKCGADWVKVDNKTKVDRLMSAGTTIKRGSEEIITSDH